LADTEIVFGVRELTCHTDSDSDNKSGNSSGGESCGAQAKDQKHKDHSQKHGNVLVIHFFSVLCTRNIVYLLNRFLFLYLVSKDIKS